MQIGLDIGGTKIEVCVLDENGECQFRRRVSTPATYQAFLTTVSELILVAERQAEQACTVGLGLPGAISPVTGLVKNANREFLNGQNLKGDLEALINRPVAIGNDANCFALSEAIDGAGRDGRVVFGAILGTGCGGGWVIDKHVRVGANAIAGEWGHNPLPSYDRKRDGEPRHCYCGHENCLEQFISGTGFEWTYRAAGGEAMSASDIMQRVRFGEPLAERCYRLLVDQMARSFAALINLLDPDVIVLGGGLSNVDSLYEDLPIATRPYIYSDYARLTFKKAHYGDSSGIRGAAWLGV